jgi:cystathionine beta-synthase
LLKRELLGDLRDIIGRRYDEGSVISVAPGDTLMTAFNRMRSAEVSQLPVMEAEEQGRGQHVIGIIDESDVLLKVAADAAHFSDPVSSTMTSAIEKLAPTAGVDALRSTLARGLVAIIADGDRFYGLITRFDLLNHLRRSLS